MLFRALAGVAIRRSRELAFLSELARSVLGPQDFVVIGFGESSAKLGADLRAKGGFVVNCNHGAGHCESPPEVLAAQWQFLKAHPFGVTPKPYAGGLCSMSRRVSVHTSPRGERAGRSVARARI